MDIQSIIYFMFAAVLLASAIAVVTVPNPVHSALFLIVSFFSAAGIWIMLQAEFLGILLILVYVGAVMVLFLFVVMMLNQGPASVQQERIWLKPNIWIGPTILSALLLAELLYVLFAHQSGAAIGQTTIDAKAVGISLFGPYLLVVELASMLLLAAAVTAFHLGRNEAKEQ